MYFLKNPSHHIFDIIHHVAIPKSHNPISSGCQIGCTFSIIFFLVKMLAAIQFDNKFLTWSAEIGDIWTYSVLAAKMNPLGTVGAQISPQFSLGGSGFFAQFPGTVHHFWRGASGLFHR